MVLADLGKRLNNALGQLSKASVVDDQVCLVAVTSTGNELTRLLYQAIESVIKELVSALLEADVNVKLVASLRTKIRARASPDETDT